MKALTKQQTEAIVDEVQDRLRNLQGPDVLPKRAEGEWARLRPKIDKCLAMEKEVEEMEQKLDEMKDAFKEEERLLDSLISTFEDRHGVNVDWKYLDEGEEPSVKIPVKDYKAKIARQIAIISIDKSGPLTADEIIETILSKFMAVNS